MHYYMYHLSDFNNATRYLSRLERSIYRDLLDMYYEQESAIDGTDMPILERRLLIRSTEEQQALAFVLKEFFENQDGFYFNNRCESEIKKYQDKLETAIKAGKASGDARRKKARKRQRVEPDSANGIEEFNGRLTDVEQTLNENTQNVEPTINHQPETINQEPVINTQDWRDERFEEFYELYPNKKSKGQAKVTWNHVFIGNKTHSKPENPEELFEQIMVSVKAQTPTILSSEPSFRKHPSTWLNAQAWLDEVSQPPVNHQSSKPQRSTPDPLAVNAKYNVPTEMTDEEKRQWFAGEVASDIPSSFMESKSS
ncbi:YdaU family protein [Psychrobacter sp.]|uniref:YdaU family protein n=1 Tax=Psychrobacter sp. TaxID=56811 RepID=UPI0035694D64